MDSNPKGATFGASLAKLQYLVIALLGIVFAAAAVAASPNPNAQSESDASKVVTLPAESSKTVQALTAVQQAWVNAEIHRDAAALRRILSPKFIFTFGLGAPESRDSFIHAVVTARTDMKSQTLSETTLVTDRDTAIVAGLDTVRGLVHGKPYKAVYRYMVTYIRRNGHWIALAEHLAPVPDMK